MSTTDFLRPVQRVALEEDYRIASAALTDPTVAPYIEDKARARKQAQTLKQTLESKSPKPFSSDLEKNEALAKARQLQDEIKEGMLSVQEMRRNRDALSASTTMHHLKWERANKEKILEWKYLRARLDPDSDDPDLCNIERFRPQREFGYDSTAQLPGVHAMSEKAKANWPEELGDPKAKTAVSHLKK